MKVTKKVGINWHAVRVYTLYGLGFVIAGLTAVSANPELGQYSAATIALTTFLGGVEYFIRSRAK